VPRRADEKQQEKSLEFVQATLDQLVERGKEWLKKED